MIARVIPLILFLVVSLRVGSRCEFIRPHALLTPLILTTQDLPYMVGPLPVPQPHGSILIVPDP